MKKPNQYSGPLTSAQIAAGMNAARENAVRLSSDARLLFQNEKYPSALALAVLAIEETGKDGVLRGLAVARDEAQLRKSWRNYRTHTIKNAHWLLADLLAKGARRFDDFLPMFEPGAKHTLVLDVLKQICLYTDSFKRGLWSIPTKVVKKEVSEAFVTLAELLCKTREVTAEEIDLWIKHLQPVWHVSGAAMNQGLIEWDKEMRRRGLISGDGLSVEEFVSAGITPKKKSAATAGDQSHTI